MNFKRSCQGSGSATADVGPRQPTPGTGPHLRQGREVGSAIDSCVGGGSHPQLALSRPTRATATTPRSVPGRAPLRAPRQSTDA